MAIIGVVLVKAGARFWLENKNPHPHSHFLFPHWNSKIIVFYLYNFLHKYVMYILRDILRLRLETISSDIPRRISVYKMLFNVVK